MMARHKANHIQVAYAPDAAAANSALAAKAADVPRHGHRSLHLRHQPRAVVNSGAANSRYAEHFWRYSPCESESSGPARSPTSTRRRTRTSATSSPSAPTSSPKRARSSPTSTAANSCPPTKRSAAIPKSITSTSAPSPTSACSPSKSAPKQARAVQVQKPIVDQPGDGARDDRNGAQAAGIVLGVVSQHRFDDSTHLREEGHRRRPPRQDPAGRRLREVVALAEVLLARPSRAAGNVEGGGALINQAIHQVDVLLYLVGGVAEVFGYWQLGARHKIESEDVITAHAASTATAPPASSRRPPPSGPATRERIEIHGTKGTCIIHRRQAHHLGRRGRRGRPRAGREGSDERRVRSDGHFARALRTPVPRFRRRHHSQAARRSSPAKKASARSNSSWASTSPAATGKSSEARRMSWTEVRVPASSANLGPGFDALGMALSIYLECRFRPRGPAHHHAHRPRRRHDLHRRGQPHLADRARRRRARGPANARRSNSRSTTTFPSARGSARAPRPSSPAS